MIKILSGWSNKGGSTFAFINLTNALNKAGYDTTFYGPHEWHLDKCKSDLLNNVKLTKEDKLIVHFLNLGNRPDVDRVLLSCHEKNIFEVGDIRPFWDEVIFLNEKQRKYHSRYNGKYSTIPNLREPLVKNDKFIETEKIAAVIGSIDENKQTHISIDRALGEGYEKVILYGNVTDEKYYNEQVKPLIGENVIEYGFESNKQKIYDSVGAVFLSSKSEVASLVKDECETTGTKFYGNYATNHDVIELTNDEIINEWIKKLGL
jgi:hypothetical protein